jgi:hypothetical protein
MIITLTCTIPGCDRPLRCVGLCRAHYHRSQVGRALDGPIRPWRRKNACADAAKVVSGRLEEKKEHPPQLQPGRAPYENSRGYDSAQRN